VATLSGEGAGWIVGTRPALRRTPRSTEFNASKGGTDVALTEVDRNLLRRCLSREPGAWREFVDRFLGLIYRVVEHTAYCRSMNLSREDMEDICAQIMLEIVKDDYALLRRFAGRASLATYLTVVARRICVHELVRRAMAAEMGHTSAHAELAAHSAEQQPQKQVEEADEIEQLIKQLNPKEAAIVRLYYLEGKNYAEISRELGIAMNSIGPTLHRARRKLKELRGTESEHALG